ncbi:MAG: 7-cyano-7-deazaguanine synthase [Methanomassiliicoccales archaeon]|nr:7-cyano-7-deazaguanine synthase [Methanomassiliicoccales archaeon]
MRVVCLLSGGIDSPVAAFMMLDRGLDVVLLHMGNSSAPDEVEARKVDEIRHRLESVADKEVALYVAPHARNQDLIEGACQKGFQCVLCKRLMLRVARDLAKRIGGEAIVTGESLGQVASQTLHNLRAESHGLDFPVLRPLIGLDKIEIETIAKRIGTYEMSTRTTSVCRWVPSKPATMAKPWRVSEEESKLDVEEMARYSAERASEVRGPHT